MQPVQGKRQQDMRERERERRTTPTFTLSGEGSARKASVTPRMGSLAAGSTWPNSDAMDLDAGRSGPLRRGLIAAEARDMAIWRC
jgi:hypothetical protein